MKLSIQLQKQGYKPTWRFSPGYGNWPLEIQPQLAKIIKTEMIGWQVTENYLLFPMQICNSYYWFNAS